jgi:hypothetical protein
MEPERIAELLALMEPSEAVLILAAMGEVTGGLVAQQLSSQERHKLIDLLKGADGEGTGWSGACSSACSGATSLVPCLQRCCKIPDS